jgi:hypothetical protein
MKNKQIRNLKQYRVRSKFLFYVVFRPKAQVLFFPVLGLILLIAILSFEYQSRGSWVFENVEAASFEEAKPESVITTQEMVSGNGELAQGDIEKMVRAICTIESNCNSDRIGDNGQSYGAFQIHLPSHPNITKEQAMDYEWAKQWTINHGKKYLDNPALFFKNHNGIAKTSNGWYVERAMTVYQSL